MISILVLVLVVIVVVSLIWWLCDYLPVPEPMNKLAKVVSMVIGCIIIIYALLGMAGMAPPLSLR